MKESILQVSSLILSLYSKSCNYWFSGRHLNELYDTISLTCYVIIKAYRELNLARTWDEDTRVFSFFSSSPLGQTAVSGKVSELECKPGTRIFISSNLVLQKVFVIGRCFQARILRLIIFISSELLLTVLCGRLGT